MLTKQDIGQVKEGQRVSIYRYAYLGEEFDGMLLHKYDWTPT